MANKDQTKRNLCAAITSEASCPVQRCGWREVRSMPPRTQWHPATDRLVGTDVYGTPFNDKDPWSVKYDHTIFDQFMFTTGDLTQWLVATRDSVIGGWYQDQLRPILKSSKNANPHAAKWYRRESGFLEDPWVGLGDYWSFRHEILYGGASLGHNIEMPSTRGGARVFIRDSTANTDPVCLGPDTVPQRVGCQWTPAAATSVQTGSYCAVDAYVLDRLGQTTLAECNQACFNMPGCVNFAHGTSRCDLLKAGCTYAAEAGTNCYKVANTVEPATTLDVCTVQQTSRVLEST